MSENTSASGGTCLVHLIWAPIGTAPLRRFLDSYTRHASGAQHRLLVLYNGFQRGQDTAPWQAELSGIAHEVLDIPAPVQDLDAYRYAAERVPAKRYCFLNSYSVVQTDGWLGFLEAALMKPDVGLAGATGSWASLSSHMRYGLHLGGPYAQLFDDHAFNARVFRSLASETQPSRSLLGRIATGRIATALEVPRILTGFHPFPSHHLRTNGFMVDRDVWKSVRIRPLRRKLDAHLMESGRHSVTRQVEAIGQKAVVVGRSGDIYEQHDWARSGTQWQGEQENLLIADNQTEAYENAGQAVRKVLSSFAWGAASQSAVATAQT
jgi:hypothetical protein